MPRYMLVLLLLAGLSVAGLALSCAGNDDDDDDADDDQIDDDDDDDDDQTDDDDDDDDLGPFYDPSWAVPMSVLEPARGRTWERGIIHAHSIYSHDACDNKPVGNTECLMQLREALCTTRQNYFMLTDHADMFGDTEYPDTLLYLPDEGDELLYDDDELPIANVLTCPDQTEVIIMAGSENDIMPIHMHRHLEGTPDERKALYGRRDPAAAPLLRELGASVIVNHDEQWTIDALKAFAPDGIEVFNLHAAIGPNTRPDLGLGGLDFVDDLLVFLLDPLVPHPNLAIMTFWPETEVWNERWDALLGVQRCYGVAATDVHRNALPFPLSDGERADGYRRMMQFFSNHILTDEHTPAGLEEAIDHGRLIAVFEFLGFPQGFDFYAADSKATYDMGDEVAWNDDLNIHVSAPQAFYIDPAGPQPEITLELVRIDESGSESVAWGETSLDYAPDGPGVFRAVVRIVPHHLEPFLGSTPERFVHEYPWIYANPIYVR